jgi:hypothetical protein
LKRFVRFCSKIQYLGLLGLPGLFSDNKLFDVLWLFWLFGFVVIFNNLPVFLQSLKQLWGMLIIPFRYGSHIPSAENYRCKVKYSLPFEGEWTVVNGGIDPKTSHSWTIPTQRYAYDFVILDKEGHSFSGDRTNAEAYHCYGKSILAPADGEVVEVLSASPDSALSGNGKVDCAARDIRGNFILLRHADHEYSLFAHLKPESICVKVGDRVQRGQRLALCGNSGNTSEPHLHFHLQDGTSFYASAGLPVEFSDIASHPAQYYAAFDPRPTSLTISSEATEKYIMRGQQVTNI